MTILRQALDKLQLANLHATAERGATGSATGVDVQAFDGDLVLILDSAAGSGTSPTLDVTIENSDTLNGTYAAITGAAFTRVTDAAASQQRLVISKDEARRFIRVTYTIGGSNTPKFTFSVNAVGVRKYG